MAFSHIGWRWKHGRSQVLPGHWASVSAERPKLHFRLPGPAKQEILQEILVMRCMHNHQLTAGIPLDKDWFFFWALMELKIIWVPIQVGFFPSKVGRLPSWMLYRIIFKLHGTYNMICDLQRVVKPQIISLTINFLASTMFWSICKSYALSLACSLALSQLIFPALQDRSGIDFFELVLPLLDSNFYSNSKKRGGLYWVW